MGKHYNLIFPTSCTQNRVFESFVLQHYNSPFPVTHPTANRGSPDLRVSPYIVYKSIAATPIVVFI